ncbi:hypothetical protein QBC37DRAFT_464656 [Rhypophila decipiens]|uniref:Uncharacterized protein n=1 Tax=Rhypophila decipiens TaxID=261697 RepID=A0AAN6Y817_9PEZI|nr:hypothetical protein QBC37DRAFT_464656 [Rhypophila decipiens]
MPPQLLPASAAAFAPRATSVNVVLGSKVEPWLTQTLKRINRIKRPLNSVVQHQRCLTEILSSLNAIWTLASLMVPKAPEADLKKDSNPLIEAIFNYQLIHLEAYIVHVDMVLRNEVAYKLTPDTIESLIEYHKDIHCDGAGELLCGKSKDVKNSVMALIKPLLPPPPRIVDVVRQPPLLPSSPANASMRSQPTTPSSLPAPVDSWRVLSSSPSVTSTSADSTGSSIWASIGLSEAQLPSPVVTAPLPHLPLPSMLASQCGVSVGCNSFGWDRYQEYTTTM